MAVLERKCLLDHIRNVQSCRALLKICQTWRCVARARRSSIGYITDTHTTDLEILRESTVFDPCRSSIVGAGPELAWTWVSYVSLTKLRARNTAIRQLSAVSCESPSRVSPSEFVFFVLVR